MIFFLRFLVQQRYICNLSVTPIQYLTTSTGITVQNRKLR